MKFTWVDGLMILLSVLVIYMILTRIFGHSATELAIMVGLFSILFVNQYKGNRELGELNVMMKQSFGRIRDDMKNVQERLARLEARK